MMKKAFVLVFLCSMIINGYSQGTIPVKGYYKINFVFESGFWVYQDTVNNDIDSITLTNCTHNYLYPNPGCPDYQEFYRMEFHSHSYNYSFNEFIITEYWKRNGGGEYGELGQPVMHIGQYDQYPEIGNGFNGYEIIALLDNIEVAGAIYTDVVVSRVYEDQQYQYEFEYDTDLYFAPGVGIIREEYIDDLGINHVWDLINFETSIYTKLTESSTEDQKLLIYPNPAHEQVSIFCRGMKGIEISDTQGRLIMKKDCKSNEYVFDISGIAEGLYFITIAANNTFITKRLIFK